MVRILQVAESGRGGVPAFIRRICDGLTGEFDFGIVCPTASDLYTRPPRGAVTYPIEIAHWINPVGDFRAANRLRAVIDSGPYDLVHLNSTKAGVLGVPLKGRLNARTIFTPHALRSHAYSGRSIKRQIALFIEKRICNAADLIAACSSDEAERVVEAGLAPPEKISIIENGVDIGGLSAASALSRRDIGVPEEAFLVGTVGRLSPQKDPETFVRAARLVADELPKAHFVMAGDGPLDAEISTLVSALGLTGRLHLLGWREDADEVLKLFDAFVFTSRYEGGPFVILEAAAARRPMVACDSPGVRSMVRHRVSGLLATAGDPAAVAAAVLELHKDSKLAQSLAATAFEQIAWPRRLEVMMDGWGALYRSMLEEPVPAQAVQPAQRHTA